MMNVETISNGAKKSTKRELWDAEREKRVRLLRDTALFIIRQEDGPTLLPEYIGFEYSEKNSNYRDMKMLEIKDSHSDDKFLKVQWFKGDDTLSILYFHPAIGNITLWAVRQKRIGKMNSMLTKPERNWTPRSATCRERSLRHDPTTASTVA